MRQTILLIDDDSQVTAALGMALECPGRTVIICSDLESGELALRRFPVTDVVSDVQFSGRFGFEGLHFLERLRETVPQGRVILMTGFASTELRNAAAGFGATTLLGKPFEISELEQLLGTPGGVHAAGVAAAGAQAGRPAPHGDGAQAGRPAPHVDDQPYELIRVASIDEILSERTISTAFQPIVAVGNEQGQPFAFEALTRVPGGWPCGGPAELFEYAARRGRAVELNRVATAVAIEAAASLPKNALVFFNIDPPTFNDPKFIGDVVGAAKRAGLPLDRVVLEITERSALIDSVVSNDSFDALRAHGVRFALDDQGSAYSHLSTISRIQPSFIKISGVFGTGFELNADKERVIRHVVALAHDFGCATVLEGIESRETAAAAAGLGIELAQGYFFSKPRDISHWRGAAA